jgi:hypothetical protein
MPRSASRAQAAFDAIANELLGRPGIEEGTGFGKNPGLRSAGSIFAMLVRDELVVKLPAARCAELIDAGAAHPFEVGRRRMREWVSIPHAAGQDWRAVVDEALAFVRG